MTSETEKIHHAVIIGSGPSGWTAAIYLARANLSPVLYAGAMIGGQLTTTTEVENFPGFPEGIDGPELMENMEKQAKRFDTEVIYSEIESVDFSKSPLELKTSSGTVRAHSVIIATGASPRMLGLDSEQTYWNRGVHTCAVCDGGFYKQKEVAIVGGGDSSMEEATYLAKLCKKVYVIHRRDELRASKIMAERVLNNPNIEMCWNSTVDEVMGAKVGLFPKVTKLRLRDTKDDSTREIVVDAMFLAIGHIPNTKFLGDALKTDNEGFLIVDEHLQTNIEGVYAAGDVHDKHYRQAITAAGLGCRAALEVERYLTRKGVSG
jgi:thioredoxin reductase (NADPH)